MNLTVISMHLEQKILDGPCYQGVKYPSCWCKAGVLLHETLLLISREQSFAKGLGSISDNLKGKQHEIVQEKG